jgi:hypothetical protein
VPGDDTVQAMQAFVARHGLEHVQQFVDLDGRLRSRFGVVGQPVWVFVDGETGRAETIFALTEDAMVERLDALAD